MKKFFILILSILMLFSCGMFFSCEYLEEFTDVKQTQTASEKNNYVKKIGPYTYFAHVDNLATLNDSPVSLPGGCTSFIRDGKLYRNMDWNYDKSIYFYTEYKGIKGMAYISSVKGNSFKQSEISQLPYHFLDGINDSGIAVTTHVLFNEFDFDGCGEENTPIYILPFKILSEVKSMNELNEKVSTYLSNLSIPQTLIDNHYLCQFLVSDGTRADIISPKVDGTGYEIIENVTNKKMTNFKFIDESTVDLDNPDLQTYATGIERFNLIDENTTLEDLRFTKAYESPDRLSEFIGIIHDEELTDINTDTEVLEDIYDVAHDMYLNRTRNGELWHTAYSCVYDFGTNKLEKLFVQENFDRNLL